MFCDHRNVKLSVCITTYNRARFIGETLDSILSQVTEEVEVVVVDGASTDNTGDVLREYSKRYSALRCHREMLNKGLDKGYDKAVELAAGDYCWLMSDDDLLRDGAIQTILGKLREKYDLIIVNAEVRNTDFSKLIDDRVLKATEDRVYSGKLDYSSFFTDTAQYLSFIGGVVIKKDIWNARKRDDYYGTEFIHMGVMFQDYIEGVVYVVSQPLISIRYGNSNWSSRAVNMWLFIWPKLIWSFKIFTDSEKNKVCQKEPWRKLKSLFFYRALGVYSPKEYSEWIMHADHSFLYRIPAKIIAMFPGPLANFATYVYLASRGEKIRIADLINSRYYYKRFLKIFKGDHNECKSD